MSIPKQKGQEGWRLTFLTIGEFFVHQQWMTKCPALCDREGLATPTAAVCIIINAKGVKMSVCDELA